MRKFALSLAVLALVAAPAFAGKYNKVISVGDRAPDISGIPAIETPRLERSTICSAISAGTAEQEQT